MKKLVMTGPKKSSLVEVDMPRITEGNQIIVKLKYCGVCMSEHYDWSVAKAGSSFGHEPMGIVYAVGDKVSGFKVGDRVSGAFAGNAEYVLTSEDRVYPVSDNVTDEQAVYEPLMCIAAAVSKVKISMLNERVAVVGCGYMGCGAISLLKKRGAYVVAVDKRPESVENALKFGADEAYLTEDLPKSYLDIPGTDLDFSCEEGRGFSLVMEWGETEDSLDLAIKMTRQCGQLAIGAYHTGGKRLVDVQMLNVKAIDCLSTHPREADINHAAYVAISKMLANDTWIYKYVPTKIYPITKFDLAHEELETKFGKYLKALVDWESLEGEPYLV